MELYKSFKDFGDLAGEIIWLGGFYARENWNEGWEIEDLLKEANVIEAEDYDFIEDHCNFIYKGKLTKKDIKYLTELYVREYRKELNRLIEED